MRADGLDAGTYVRLTGSKSLYKIEAIHGFTALLSNVQTGKLRKGWISTGKIRPTNPPQPIFKKKMVEIEVAICPCCKHEMKFNKFTDPDVRTMFDGKYRCTKCKCTILR